jgi:hypothetical protein
MRLRRLALPLALVAPLALPLLPASAAGPLQPGAYVESDTGGCTFNFAYDGVGKLKGRVYLGTAAHCVEGVGDRVRDEDGTVVGRVALMGDADSTAADYAFIEIDQAHRSRVVAAVKGHPQFPTGVTTARETAVGDVIQNSGYGVGFHLVAASRERRQAVLTADDDSIWEVAGAISFGDSGGPLVHVASGKALGIESRVCIGACTDEGPTVEGILRQAAGRGFPLRLRTV